MLEVSLREGLGAVHADISDGDDCHELAFPIEFILLQNREQQGDEIVDERSELLSKGNS